MSSTIDEYAYLWKDKDAGWVLVRLPAPKGAVAPAYGIQNRRTKEALVIEDDALAAAVTAEMLRQGVQVLRAGGS